MITIVYAAKKTIILKERGDSIISQSVAFSEEVQTQFQNETDFFIALGLKDMLGQTHTNIFDYFDIMGFQYSNALDVEFIPMRPCMKSDLAFMAEDKSKINWALIE